jgi:predicted transcriptional regulator of viral defense system
MLWYCRPVPGGIQKLLREIFLDQLGFISHQSQAREIGVSAINLARMAKRGQLERVSTGLYRFLDHPRSDLDRFMAATLWPQREGAVLSHDRAIELYDVSDIAPAAAHVTLTTARARSRRTVPTGLRVHYVDVTAPRDSRRQKAYSRTLPNPASSPERQRGLPL